MKELSIAGKATRYDEALKEAVIAHKDEDRHLKATLERIFPELKESEDMIMVKFIKNQLFNIKKTITENYELDAKLTKAIDWLEKQCGQKPADETKFKVGEWVVYCNDDVDLITGIEENGYCINNGGYIPFVCESDIRLWTIEDAKDGDVLVASDGSIFIFKGTIDCACKHYVALTTDDVVKFNEGLEHYWETSTAVHPATKKQRDQLEKAMADAGYTFDFEKKELKKIAQNPVIEMKTPEESLGVDSDTYNKIVDECVYGEQKSAWSEEDEAKLKSILFHISDVENKDVIDWFKALKDRVQPKQEWSEEDEKILNLIIARLHSHPNVEVEEYGKDYHWLKSLKQRYTWKPSDEQMDALRYVTNFDYGGYKATLVSLYEQLKKLIGE